MGGFGGLGGVSHGACQHLPWRGSGHVPRMLMSCVPLQGPQGQPGSRGQDGAQVRGWAGPPRAQPPVPPAARPSPLCVSGRAGPPG